jgi:hypothetical protein
MVIGYRDSLTEGLFRHKGTPHRRMHRINTTDYIDNPQLELQNETVDDPLDLLVAK